ncbi:hypothetical protein SUDANB178_07233 [Streptomyces sp. enrichment culture]
MDHDNPCPGPLPHRTCAEPVGGPLDGLLPDVHGRRTEEVDDGVARATELSRWPAAVPCTIHAPAKPAHPGPGVSCRLHCSGDRPDQYVGTTGHSPYSGPRATSTCVRTSCGRAGHRHRAVASRTTPTATSVTTSGCSRRRPGAAAGVLRGTASGAGDGPDDDLCRDPPCRTCHDRTGRRGSSSRLKRSPSTPRLPRLLLGSGRRPSHRPDDREARTSTSPRAGAPGAASVIVAVRSGRRTRGSADAGEHSSYPASTSAVVASRRHQALRCPPPARCPAARQTCG